MLWRNAFDLPLRARGTNRSNVGMVSHQQEWGPLKNSNSLSLRVQDSTQPVLNAVPSQRQEAAENQDRIFPSPARGRGELRISGLCRVLCHPGEGILGGTLMIPR
jgi:hypothetical protein